MTRDKIGRIGPPVKLILRCHLKTNLIPRQLNFSMYNKGRPAWRGRLVVYGARLESVLGFTALEGSNPSPSATFLFISRFYLMTLLLKHDVVYF
jgi:hypothetical protein